MPIPAEQKPMVRTTARERVYKTLQQWIINGTLLPEERLKLSASDRVVADAGECLGVRGESAQIRCRAADILFGSEGFVIVCGKSLTEHRARFREYRARRH